MVTLAFGTIIQILINEMTFLTEGPMGITLSKPTLFGHQLDETEFYWVVLACLVASLIFVHSVLRSQLADAACSGLGIPPGLVREDVRRAVRQGKSHVETKGGAAHDEQLTHAESALLSWALSDAVAREALSRLRTMGVAVMLDEFGPGAAGLDALRTLPLVAPVTLSDFFDRVTPARDGEDDAYALTRQ